MPLRGGQAGSIRARLRQSCQIRSSLKSNKCMLSSDLIPRCKQPVHCKPLTAGLTSFRINLNLYPNTLVSKSPYPYDLHINFMHFGAQEFQRVNQLNREDTYPE